MKTDKTVADGNLSDEQLGKLFRRTNEIKRRIEEGTIPYSDAMSITQLIIEGKSQKILNLFRKPSWETWKELEPSYLDVKNLMKRLTLRCGQKYDDYALKLLSRFPYLYENGNFSFPVRLAKVRVSDLKIDTGKLPTISDVYRQALNLGLTFCHPSIAYRLRYNYQDQMENENLEIGMYPLITPEYNSLTFQLQNLQNPAELRIGINTENKLRICSDDDMFIFQF